MSETGANHNQIKVIVRVRPFLDDEEKSEEQAINTQLKIRDSLNEVEVHQEKLKQHKLYKFDKVLKSSTTQGEVFDDTFIPQMLKRVVDGYHSTIFAYGQTGSGKTYTMEGYKYYQNEKGIQVPKVEDNPQENGLVSRCAQRLFEDLQEVRQHRKISVNVSFLQIYNEKIYDLLNGSMFKKNNQMTFGGPQNDPVGLKLKWNQFDVYTVENLYTFECDSVEQVLSLFHFGIKNKVIGSHKMNMSSSRSHTIFTINLEQIEADNPDNVILSKLQMVDLAGSERQSYTSVQGRAQKESIEINKSLFTLRQVISSLNELANGKKEGVYVPYRDSKLTCLLRQSIGGNAYCCMIACLHPSAKYLEENVSTMTYASKAALISNQPIRNDDPKTMQIEELKSQVILLTTELLRANQHIQFLSQLTGQKPEVFGGDIVPSVNSSGNITIHNNYSSNVVAYYGKNKPIDNKILPSIKQRDNLNQTIQDIDESPIILDGSKAKNLKNQKLKNLNTNNQANIQHQLSLAKEAFNGAAQLQDKLQKQSMEVQSLKSELFQKSLENDDLRQRLQYLESLCGKDSTFIRDNISEETSKVDWARLLLDDSTDDMIISASREKIAHELLRLRTSNQKLQQQVSNNTSNNLHSSSVMKSKSQGPKNLSQYSNVLSMGNSRFSLVGHKKQTAVPQRQKTNEKRLIPTYSSKRGHPQSQRKKGSVSDLGIISGDNQYDRMNQSTFSQSQDQNAHRGYISRNEGALNYSTTSVAQSMPVVEEETPTGESQSPTDFRSTSELIIQNLFNNSKITMPFPHVTLRKKGSTNEVKQQLGDQQLNKITSTLAPTQL